MDPSVRDLLAEHYAPQGDKPPAAPQGESRMGAALNEAMRHGNAWASFGNNLLGGMPAAAADMVGIPFGMGGGRAREAAGRGLDDFRQLYPNVAKPALEMLDNPIAQGIFLGPMGVRRLQNAGKLHASDPGGTERLKAAQEQWKQGSFANMTRPEIWREHGWTPSTTWGLWNTEPVGSPATYLHAPDLRINPDMLRPMKSGDTTILTGSGPFQRMTMGDSVDDILTAAPDLRDVPLRVQLDPLATRNSGATGFDEVGRHGDRVAAEMFMVSPRLHGANETLGHETAHAVGIPQRVAVPRFNVAQGSKPLTGTPAEHHLREMERVLQSAYETSRGPERDQILTDLVEVRRQLHEAPKWASYLHEGTERSAREAVIRHKMGASAQGDVAPGRIDTYQPGALDPLEEATWEVPLKAFDPSGKWKP